MPEELKQWVHEVTNFSSQYANEERISFSVNNLPGVPNVYPHHGESVEAFELRSYGAWDRQSPSFLSSYLNEPWASKVSRTVTDFVDVKLRVPVIPSSIEIFETYNPGAVSAIWAFRWANNSWTSLWASNGVPGDTESHKSGTSRIFSPQLRKIPFKTDLLRFEFNTSYSPHHVQIDAIRVISNPGVMVDPVVEERNVDHTSELRRKVAELNLRCDPADLLAVFSKFMEQEYADFVKHFQSRLNGLEWLPDYVIMKILGYLDLKSLCALSRVNRHLYRLSSDPLLYRKLDMRPYWPQLRGKCLFKYLSSKCSVLRMLDLSWCGCYGAITANEFCKIMDRFGHTLLGLWLDYCDFLTSDVIKMLHIWCPQLKDFFVLFSSKMEVDLDFVRTELFVTKTDREKTLELLGKADELALRIRKGTFVTQHAAKNLGESTLKMMQCVQPVVQACLGSTKSDAPSEISGDSRNV
ncbi:unnamed protein product [Notodromas monacha]|uniref:F-box domain-containing protein n=1 Tax=Notodromas monacha TaxID=399045 RepID=A0A7R9BFA0_9CRUS|nr:unnamed protein product [Notodromas monacha]CAG0914236.1 unnamed protein product [Notodromas monacha]